MPVLKWLTDKLLASRDQRGKINRKQGVLNYSLRAPREEQQIKVDTSKHNAIIFNNKPKRAYKANRSTKLLFSDPTRVHIALREFNDISANSVFQKVLEQIEASEQEESGGKLAMSWFSNKKGASTDSKEKRGTIIES